MSLTVIDPSAALAWLLPSQSTRASEAFLRGAGDRRLLAPAIYLWEVRNVMLSLERRRLLTAAQYETARREFANLEVQIEEPIAAEEVESLAELARSAGLSLFDAAYLALALRVGGGLATRDNGLANAAAAAGLVCHDLRGEVSR